MPKIIQKTLIGWYGKNCDPLAYDLSSMEKLSENDIIFFLKVIMGRARDWVVECAGTRGPSPW